MEISVVVAWDFGQFSKTQNDLLPFKWRIKIECPLWWLWGLFKHCWISVFFSINISLYDFLVSSLMNIFMRLVSYSTRPPRNKPPGFPEADPETRMCMQMIYSASAPRGSQSWMGLLGGARRKSKSKQGCDLGQSLLERRNRLIHLGKLICEFCTVYPKWSKRGGFHWLPVAVS